ncbi:MAG: bifunctional riboflavin kinase/FAD synthetase [Pseudomonadota bacterium]
MQLIRGLYNLRPEHRGTALTLGNFDGVHRGHQAIIERLRALGASRTSVLLFEPTPREYFDPVRAPRRLMRFGEKLDVLATLGVDQVVCLRFDERIASLAPETFVERLLVDGLGVTHVLVGADARYGRHRTGSFDTLKAHGERAGFAVDAAPTVCLDGERVSSTRIRAALAAHDFVGAQGLLGRPYAMSGRVIHGQKLGRTLGYPTANIPVRRLHSPLHGIFAVRVAGVVPGEDEARWPGVASLGSRPTVNGEGLLLEVCLFDFSGDLYGKRLRVEFVEHLRDEVRFDSLEALTRQMDEDAAAALEALARDDESPSAQHSQGEGTG